MKRLVAIFLCGIAAGVFTISQPRAASRAPAASPWKLVWSDEFNGPDGSAPDPRKWTYDLGIGGNGWGNQELEYYTNLPKNVQIAKGNLEITAVQESFSGPGAPGAPADSAEAKAVTRQYTSARLKTLGLFSQTYGRFEARIKIPHGEGMWPAFWMLGNDIDSGGWPRCGEIDIMENIGKEPGMVHGSLHGPLSPGKGTDDITAPFTLLSGKPFSDDFHLYAVEWEPKTIRFYVDDQLYLTSTPANMPHGTGWVFDHPFFLLLNLAVGGSWPGSPGAATVFPQKMLVDYVRVYRTEAAR